MKLTRKRVLMGVGSVLALLVFFVAGGLAGFAVGQNAPPGFATASLTTDGLGSAKSNSQLWKPFWQTYQYITRDYYGRPVNQEKLMNGAAEGLASSVGDPYTMYLPPKQQKELQSEMSGQFEGIGVYVEVKDKQFVVVSPIDNSPAQKAGIKSGDVILEVNGKPITGMDQMKVVNMIRGPKGTPVTLTIQRDGRKPFKVRVVRNEIQVPQVTYKRVDGDVGYIRISIFGDKTVQELDSALRQAKQDHVRGIILDLRDNGGGWVDAARSTVGRFLPNGVAFYEDESKGPGGEQPVSVETGSVSAYKLPMVVLVNGGTASASEITAGALQARDRAKLVGERTFGKGSEQEVEGLSNGGSVHVTIAHWLTPDKVDINHKGLKPDYVVKTSSKDQETSGPQFRKALEVLKSEIARQG